MYKARAVGGMESVIKLIVGAGQASPSPPVGPALGSKGLKSMDFCKVGMLDGCLFGQGDALTTGGIGVQCANSSRHTGHAVASPRYRPS